MISTARMVCLLACFASSGCGAKLQRIGASSGDYGDYRAFRVAPALSARMKAAFLYLQCHSEGAFREEVADWFKTAQARDVEIARHNSNSWRGTGILPES